MDARTAVQRAVASIAIVVGACGGAVYAGPVYIYRSDFNLRIPANPGETRGWMADAVIEVPDHFTICDLDVRLTFTHESLFDLQIILKGPAGTSVVLNPAGNLAFIVRGRDGRLTAVGGSGRWFFDDEAQVPIEQAGPPFTGRFRPEAGSFLEVFDGRDSFGLWRLRIYDAFYADTGTLDSFELMITAPEPATAILLLLGTGLMRLSNPRRNPKNI